MNGLFSIFIKQNSNSYALKERLDKGLNALKHRGTNAKLFIPDRHSSDSDSDISTSFAIGICSQEKTSRCIVVHDRYKVFFDGRLLNRKELCNDIGIINDDTTSDASIVARLFSKYGRPAFALLDGFWAIIVFDNTENTIYAARDKFGCKPLFYCNTTRQLAIASEIRAINAVCEDARDINKNTLVNYLLWGNIGRLDQYFYKNIHSVEPSHFIEYDIKNDLLKNERYYTVMYNRDKTPYNETLSQSHILNLKKQLYENVERNISLYNGSLAFGVSGGMDSSALICLSKKICPDREIAAYTTTDIYDGGEVVWAEKVVRHTGAEWVKVVCKSDDILQKLNEVNSVHGIPIYNASSLTQYRMMEEMRRNGHSVFIDGQGGDELFGGYQDFFPTLLKQLRDGGDRRGWWNELSKVKNSGLSKKEMAVRRLKLIAKKYYYNELKLAQKARKHNLLSLDKSAAYEYFKSESPIKESPKAILNDALFESYTKFLENILRWGEHSAASQGIECVMPFSDSTELAEFAFSVPSVYKIHDGWNKYLLRQAMVGIVPDEIRLRKQKMGFYIPERQWLNELGDALLDGIKRMDDRAECLNKKYIIDNWKTLYTTDNFLFQQFCFRCYSYLIWVNLPVV